MKRLLLLLLVLPCCGWSLHVENTTSMPVSLVFAGTSTGESFPIGVTDVELPGDVPIGDVTVGASVIGQIPDVSMQSRVDIWVGNNGASVIRGLSVIEWGLSGFLFGNLWMGFGFVLRLTRQLGRMSPEI